MRIGLGKRRKLWCAIHTQMLQLAFANPESVVDLAQALRLCLLVEQHRNEVIPTGKAFAASLATSLPQLTSLGFSSGLSTEAIMLGTRKR